MTLSLFVPPCRMPLAERLRPSSWEDFSTGEGVDGALLEQIKRGIGIPPSLILWGPPGSGKTTFARLIQKSYPHLRVVELSAVSVGVKEVREICEVGRHTPTILFFDEIHRFSKSQQDAFLPYVERGDITLIGATTENPSFYLNQALLSRMRVVQFFPHTNSSLEKLLENAQAMMKISCTNEAKTLLIKNAHGDARKLLNMFEALVASLGADSKSKVDLMLLERVYKNAPTFFYDRSGDQHYETISAFIKSLRGSDPDAALFWCFKMIEAGEDPRFVIRRMIIFASEDIGNADPRALSLCLATAESYDRIGLPEGKIPIAQCVTYLATAPKSNRSYLAMNRALDAVKSNPLVKVPQHLKNAPTKLMKDIGHGEGYVYPHDEDNAYVPGESYLPKEITPGFYEPSNRGYERNISELMKSRKSFGK